MGAGAGNQPEVARPYGSSSNGSTRPGSAASGRPPSRPQVARVTSNCRRRAFKLTNSTFLARPTHE
eukprot:876974-Prymnesium_polylepis.1